MLKQYIITIGSFLLLFFITSQDAYAQSNISISPYSFEKESSKGEILSDSIILKNESNKSISVNIHTKDFQAKDDSGKQTFLDPNPDNPWGLATWIDIENRVNLKPQEEKEIPFEIKVPIEAQPGGHFGTIFFAINAAEKKGIKVNMQLGALLFVTVEGEINESASIKEFVIGENISKDSVTFETQITNSGNVHLIPNGKILIRDSEGNIVKDVGKEKIFDSKGNVVEIQTVDYIPFNQDLYKILPNQTRSIHATWYRKKHQNDTYHAKLILNYGKQGKTDEKTYDFEMKQSIEIQPLRINRDFSVFSSESKILIDYSNNGNINITTEPEIEIYNIFGQNVTSGTLDSNLIRRNESISEVFIHKHPFSLNYYKAIFSLNYGDETVTKEISYFVISPFVLILILGGIVILFVVRKKKKKTKK